MVLLPKDGQECPSYMKRQAGSLSYDGTEPKFWLK